MTLKVLCPYTPDRLQAETKDTLARYAPQATMIDVTNVGDDQFVYSRVLSEWWAAGEPFVVVEHDIVLHDKVMPAFETCDKPWCMYSYTMGYGAPPTWGGLGCVRFSAELLSETARLSEFLAMTPWSQLDLAIMESLVGGGYVGPHIHWPMVGHLHYPDSTPHPVSDDAHFVRPPIVRTESGGDDRAPSLIGRYLLEAEYATGYIHREDAADQSPYQPGRSRSFDIVEGLPSKMGHGPLVRYSLIGPDSRYDIDWRTLSDDAKPIYLRRISRDIGGDVNVRAAWHNMSEPKVKHVFGFEYPDPFTGQTVTVVKEVI